MSINNHNVQQPIRCFVEISGTVGHIKYVSIQKNYSNDLLEFGDDTIRKEIFFEEEFMEKVFMPIYNYMRERYSNSDGDLVVRTLIETGIMELKRRYSSYLYHVENNMLDSFHPKIEIADTDLVPYLTEIYEHLKTCFTSGMVDEFCTQLVLYGMSVVKELPDTQVFGPNGYQRKTNWLLLLWVDGSCFLQELFCIFTLSDEHHFYLTNALRGV